jgi:phage shock protein PspC (stress-responsive transcriptional regulator)
MRLTAIGYGAPTSARKGANCMQDPTQNSQRVLRRQNGILGGVCGGLGAYFGVTPWLFRILFILLHMPAGLVLYIVLWALIPRADAPAPTNQNTYTPPTYQPPTYTPPAYTPPEQTPPPGKYD